MGIFKHITERKSSLSTDSKPVKPIVLERLEPRILLSGDGLLYAATYDPLLESVQPIVQCAEILDTTERVNQQHPAEGQEIDQNLTNPDPLETDLCEPIFTLSVEDGDINDGVAPAQVDDDLAELLDDFEENGDSKITLTEMVDVEEPIINSTTIPTEDGSKPITDSDADLSIDYATSIEIRGPPGDVSDSLTASEINTYASSDEIAESSGGDNIQQLKVPDLPGMYLVDPNVGCLEGQVFYLDFNGEQDVAYHGPEGIILEGINVPKYQVPDYLNASQESVIELTVSYLSDYFFSNSGIIFTTSKPGTCDYSTIYIGV